MAATLDGIRSPNTEIMEALCHLEALCEFAYENGFHELGYDPLHVIKKACVPVLKANILPVIWDGTITFNQDLVMNGMRVPAGTYKCTRT